MSHRTISNRLAAAVFVSGAALGLAGCNWTIGATEPPRTAASTQAGAMAATAADPEAVERGRYLVTIGGCNDCHTPFKMGVNGPEPDMSRMLQGHPEEIVINSAPVIEGGGPFNWAGAATNTAFAGPWGVSFARNLTPDENTGIGAWDETIFMNTIRNGRHWGVARPILPPMPWQNYRQMIDDDLRAVFAFLRSMPPIHNRIQEPLPPPEAMVATAAGQ